MDRREFQAKEKRQAEGEEGAKEQMEALEKSQRKAAVGAGVGDKEAKAERRKSAERIVELEKCVAELEDRMEELEEDLEAIEAKRRQSAEYVKGLENLVAELKAGIKDVKKALEAGQWKSAGQLKKGQEEKVKLKGRIKKS
ncbi:hypothetical protein NEAUS04_2524 [Nematocida ausubeli]|uniref:uncharacterized protein n=1 Tax=Nematocida major TaxID=1912982 RepID=UPI0020078EFB|nr:uncharacterized protein NEMAJ01_2335 [Nematocida major]KAH9387439.1 hypothetical protein NEMAJ01_2335 [Nematocida major]KAI5159229.1 hypothetical protein NEPAR05_2450 [Nematocida parisii]KAI5165898.1 hypothetical protein NEAUS04_2524 [Nematocida ausubeli]